MPNLFLLRNINSNKVLVTPYFRITKDTMQQIREANRPIRFNTLINRGDHWTPYCILSGLDLKTSQKIANKVINMVL